MESNKRIIVFEADPVDMLAKIAIGLKERGHEAHLVTLTSRPAMKTGFYKSAYKSITSFDAKYFRINFKNLPNIFTYSVINLKKILITLSRIRKIKPDIVIFKSPPNWMGVIAKKLLFRGCPIVYFPYDIRSDAYGTLEEIKASGVKDFEIKSEKYCFEKLDGIMHKGAPREVYELNKKILGHVDVVCPVFHLLPYTMRELTAPINKDKISKDGEIHLVYAGCVPESKTLAPNVKEILAQKIHIHLYLKQANITREELLKTLWKEHELFKDNPYYHLHDELPQEKLVKELSKYDYGTWLGYYDSTANTIIKGMGNKFSTYIEAGIPLIQFRNHVYIGNLTEKYGTGIIIDFADLKRFKKLLESTNYDKLIKNILLAREKLELRNNMPLIEKFFLDVKRYHSKNN
jgi:hypothetical protein